MCFISSKLVTISRIAFIAIVGQGEAARRMLLAEVMTSSKSGGCLPGPARLNETSASATQLRNNLDGLLPEASNGIKTEYSRMIQVNFKET